MSQAALRGGEGNRLCAKKYLEKQTVIALKRRAGSEQEGAAELGRSLVRLRFLPSSSSKLKKKTLGEKENQKRKQSIALLVSPSCANRTTLTGVAASAISRKLFSRFHC